MHGAAEGRYVDRGFSCPFKNCKELANVQLQAFMYATPGTSSVASWDNNSGLRYFCAIQEEVHEKGLSLEFFLPHVKEEQAKDGPLHEENPFGISLVEDGEENETVGAGSHGGSEARGVACASSVDDLAAKLKSLQS